MKLYFFFISSGHVDTTKILTASPVRNSLESLDKKVKHLEIRN